MTTVYFIRHAEADNSDRRSAERPLTQKGMADRARVTDFLRDKNIAAIYSSPYARAKDTLAPFARLAGLAPVEMDGFRERKSDGNWDRKNDYLPFLARQWADFNYTLSDGETLAAVQARNLAVLEAVLVRHPNESVAIATHGTALATMMKYFDPDFAVGDYFDMLNRLPWAVKAVFDGGGCAAMQKIDLFDPGAPPDYSRRAVSIRALGELKAYRFVVIFARHGGKWLYCRHRERDTFETAGGHVENGERPLDAARRELFEETGALRFDIEPAFDYSVRVPTEYSHGRVFLARIHELGAMPGFEMAETRLFDTIPEKMRFPQILPVLFERVRGLI